MITGPDGSDLGRGFAESVSYADTRRTTFALGGLSPADEQNGSLARRTTPKALALVNMAYVLLHQKQLRGIGAESAGMQFFTADPPAAEQ